MNIIGQYVYGSGDSLDRDIVYIVDELPKDTYECKIFCESKKFDNDNANIAVIKNGVISECFKGTIDELNNAIAETYCLHEQVTPLLITHKVKRDKELKYIRSVRSILSHLSRSQFRVIIKKALKGNWDERLDVLYQIATSKETIDFDSLNKKMTKYDILKVISFQIGQCMGLINWLELYTKQDISCTFPSLSGFIKRESDDWPRLQEQLLKFVEYLQSYKTKSRINENDIEVGFIIDDGQEEKWYDLKNEMTITSISF